MRFSKDYQPKRQKKAELREPFSVAVKPSTKAYFKAHRGKAGVVLDEYVEKEEKK